MRKENDYETDCSPPCWGGLYCDLCHSSDDGHFARPGTGCTSCLPGWYGTLCQAECNAAVQAAAAAASSMGAAEQAQIVRRLREVMGTNPTHATRIREIASQAGLTIR